MLIKVIDFTNESASPESGQTLQQKLKEAIESKETDITVDFAGIRRFASPFFNNSFAALGIKYGFDLIDSIKITNISVTGLFVYQNSINNAKALVDSNLPFDKYDDIVSSVPRKGSHEQM